ncbi:MAG: VCBS repeat-containing protein [Bacteroidota bacterium]
MKFTVTMKKTLFVTYISLFLGLVFLASCSQEGQGGMFTKLNAETSGVSFSNDIDDNDSSHSFINEFGYMGGGVGIGDFNNDGLKDLVFSANQSSSGIFINKGNLTFEDITLKAGLTTSVWATGVSIVDINEDGFDDIYICTYGKNLLQRNSNLLFINQRNLTFKEEAAAYGLADSGFSSQAAFFDYDKDGDLDMYLANYNFNPNGSSANNIVPVDTSGNSPANDKLYANNGMDSSTGHPVFKDVTLAAGIKEDGYGLGVSIADVNNDGWPDVYVANDFISNDRLWLNSKNGSFKNVINQSLKHQSYSSMGVDAADLNNDGWQDIVSLDMLPEWNERRKTTLGFMNYDRYKAERSRGYAPQFMRNMLQLNNGNRPGADSLPLFSDIGQMAGIAATDWSWSVLLADFDLDGWKDMHITNGVGRDFINADFLDFSNEVASSETDKAKRQDAIRRKLAALDHVRLPNYFYLNNHQLGFEDVTKTAGMADASMSNGAAWADLDNDGDPDLVVNNIDDKAFVWINQSRNSRSADSTHYLKIRLNGPTANKHGIGAKLELYNKSSFQLIEQQLVKGYYSSVDAEPIFGLGKMDRVDSLIVTWPDGKKQSILQPATDTTLVVDYRNASSNKVVSARQAPLLFETFEGNDFTSFVHTEYEVNDFARQRMLPQMFSQLGPFLTSDDVNNDGLADVFVSGATDQDGGLFLQDKTGHFTATTLPTKSRSDQLNCLFFDADKDGDKDLVITYGDLQAPTGSPVHLPRLFLNDGQASFTEKQNAFPAAVACIAGTVSAADYDGDGDLDLFLGARVADTYPVIPQSFLLRNDGANFTDVTKAVCPPLERAGMITASAWTDFDGDGKTDLVIAGDWMPVRFFKNTSGKLQEVTASTGLTATSGMWRSLKAADVDGDGDMDFIAGNLGRNCLYKTGAETPMTLHAADLDGNGIIDPVMFYYIIDKSGERKKYPAISRAQFSDQVPMIKKKFLLAKDYADADYDKIFSGVAKDKVQSLTCEETNTCLFENLGNGKFAKQVLPPEAQVAPVNAILCYDTDGDGIKDILLAGNEYHSEVVTGRYDASYGCLLKGSVNKTYKAMPNRQTGFILDGHVKDMIAMPVDDKKTLMIAAINDAALQVFSNTKR